MSLYVPILKQPVYKRPGEAISSNPSGYSNAVSLVDNRPQALIQRKLKAQMANSSQPPSLAPQKSTLPIQRKIHYSKSAGFYSDNKRPGWRKFLKDFVVDEYNKKHSTHYTSKNINLTKLHLDRCHRVSFKDIQAWLIKYLNGKNMSKTKFSNRTDRLYIATSPDRAAMIAERTRLFHAKTDKDKLAKARNLLGFLNSATGNVSLGNDSINRSIQEQLDMNFEKSGSKMAATPRSKKIMRGVSKNEASGMPTTPGGNHIKSSHVGGTIPISKLTPDTKKLVKKHTN